MGTVIVISTGGTIASSHDNQSGSVVARTSGTHLVAGLSNWSLPATVEVVELINVGSYRLGLEDALSIALKASELLAAPDVAGVVVTHGTDTMEESAFLVDLVIDSDKPVVFTGAQRPADDLDRDGPRNLANAIMLAAAPEARSIGVTVLFDQEIHAARDVYKAHSYRTGAFESAEHGKIGEIDGDQIVFQRRPMLRAHFPTKSIEPKVDLVKLAMGFDGDLVKCLIDRGSRGIVIEAFGRGNGSPCLATNTKEATTKGIPVIITSRCPQGRVKPIYGNGGGKDMLEAGGIFAGDLSGLKARVLLSVLLGRGSTMAEVSDAFQNFSG